MARKKILIVVGTRPNFIKITQFKKVVSDRLEFKIVHTGQHYDEKMATSFFTQLDVVPDFLLNIPNTSPNTQVAHIMLGLENVCGEYKPDLMIAVGDVNSTLAAAISANKLGIRLAHLEAGLRSRDRSMPEENNRILTDNLTDIFFVTEQSGVDNLIAENKPADAIHFVGNTMIDTLVAFSSDIQKSAVLEELKLERKEYILMTMHRPSNVDRPQGLIKIAEIIFNLSKKHRIVFPVHPRTRSRFKEFKLNLDLEAEPGVVLIEPKDYFSFQKLILESAFVITDSGGIQEETTFRGIPCYTLRPNTERPSTVLEGSNVLVPSEDPKEILDTIGRTRKEVGRIPHLWDGKATKRIVQILSDKL